MGGELCVSLHYGAHSSAIKEVDFVYQEIVEQAQAGQIVVSPLATVHGLPKLRLSPVAVIPQMERRLRLFFCFTWSVLNEDTAQEASEGVTRY